ncbi:MAG: TIGR03086 family metal-binding protein [Acidimicrobiales bacterium]
MTEIADRYRRLAAGFTERVKAVPADRWSSATPCEGWTATDLVAHVALAAELFLGLVDREAPPGPSATDDPVGAWEASRDAIQAGLDDPSIAGLEYEGELGQATFEMAIDRFGSADLVLHMWDLARATGLDERLDPGEVHRIFEAMEPMDEMLRKTGNFGPKVEPPPGADEQTRLLAFLGRTV